MCLLTRQRKYLVAEKPITVYKVLKKDGTSPFRKQKYSHGTNVAEGNPLISETFHSRCGYDSIGFAKPFKVYEITSGWLHSFTTFYDAVKYFESDILCYNFIKMIIPKGAKYYISSDGTTICSNKLFWE